MVFGEFPNVFFGTSREFTSLIFWVKINQTPTTTTSPTQTAAQVAFNCWALHLPLSALQ